MKIPSESAMLEFGRQFAQKLTLPTVIELVGDVGTGKTTFTRGLAAGLGIVEPVTSPSFTLSKRYPFIFKQTSGELIHYDFYRLNDPGIMREELIEALDSPHSIVVVEWGDSVADLLPASKIRLDLTLLEDGSRSVKITRGGAHEN